MKPSASVENQGRNLNAWHVCLLLLEPPLRHQDMNLLLVEQR